MIMYNFSEDLSSIYVGMSLMTISNIHNDFEHNL